METFGSRLKELRIKKELTGEELGNLLNVTKMSISRWESDQRFPDKDTLVKIANFFNVSTDYLLGRSNLKNKTSGTSTSEERLKKAQTLKDELIEMMIKRGIIKNKNDINEKHLELIEYAIETYADLTNNKRKDED